MDKVINPQYQKYTLQNGITCIVYPRNEIHSVTIRVNVKVGSLDETEKTNGISHFIEHVVHDGTEQFPTWDAVEAFKTDHSASTNAYTTTDHTQFYATFPFQYTEQAIKYMSQVVFFPTFNEEDIERERIVILDELKTYTDDVEYHVLQNIKEARFEQKDTPYQFEVIGTEQTIRSFTKQDLQSFWQQYYTPENVDIFIIGNMQEKQIESWLNHYFVDAIAYKTRASTQKLPRLYKKDIPDYSSFSIHTRRKRDIDKTYLSLTFPSPDFATAPLEERYKIAFIKAITASPSYMQSALWKLLRQELGLVYGVYAWGYDLFARDMFGVSTSFDSEHLPIVLKTMYQGIQTIKDGKITDAVFNAKKKKILDTQLMQLDKPEQALFWIVDYEEELREHGRGMRLDAYLSFIEQLSFEEILATAQNLLNWEHVNIGLVADEKPEITKKEIEQIWGTVTQQNLL